MIDEILENSRAQFPNPPRKEIYFYFPDLYEHLRKIYSSLELPTVIIVHSLNKLCETFKYGNSNYIIYDQYLGQCFNKFNRLIYYEEEREVKAYLCKLLGEEYYLINDINNCIPYLVSYHVNASANFTQLPQDFLVKKNDLIMVQESFVLFHEFAHSLVNQNPNLLAKSKTFLESTESSKIITDILKEKIALDKRDSFLSHFYEEFACDLIALELTYSFYSKKEKFILNHIIEGISLAFLYLRTLIDIKMKATGEYEISSNVFNLFTKFRYNLLRRYYLESALFGEAIENPPQLIELYEKWEEKIDMEIVVFFTDEYRDKLKNIVKKGGPPLTPELARKLLNLAE
ncbi:hypothetical protein ASU31_17615 [Pedobacter ginsenosidimutans]|uniref:Uncharacterized protein n=1 Tax=Pedobacter ginsenosidimutans TaxID=687842 RepID=A0A0T5VLH9_9SPHI|nr:hypothetical protein [Pedobacter ginsenosidimutans]KRT14722.1 hypothetical protein ASU31_17615 [Pedobacter ginsenosidimutans]